MNNSFQADFKIFIKVKKSLKSIKSIKFLVMKSLNGIAHSIEAATGYSNRTAATDLRESVRLPKRRSGKYNLLYFYSPSASSMAACGAATTSESSVRFASSSSAMRASSRSCLRSINPSSIALPIASVIKEIDL